MMSSNLGKNHVVIRLHAAIALEALQEALIWSCIHELSPLKKNRKTNKQQFILLTASVEGQYEFCIFFSHKYCLLYVLDAQPSDLSYRQLL